MELLNDVLSNSGNEWQSFFLGQSIRWDLPLGVTEKEQESHFVHQVFLV